MGGNEPAALGMSGRVKVLAIFLATELQFQECTVFTLVLTGGRLFFQMRHTDQQLIEHHMLLAFDSPVGCPT